PERARLESRAHLAGLSARIRWCGEVKDASRYLAAFDALALTSHSEGCPMVILEAMGAGVPIVATSVGGVADLVGDDGALLVPRERPDLLAEALRCVRADRYGALHRTSVARARHSERFQVGPWVEQYTRLYVTAQRQVAA